MCINHPLFKNNSNWSFRGTVVKNFDYHIKKSIPLYNHTHKLYLYLSDFFLEEKTNIVDIGCSTGTFLKMLFNKHKNVEKFNTRKLIGLDNEKDMVNKAKKKAKKYKIKFYNKSIHNFKLKNCCIISSFYTMQFIHVSKRQKIVDYTVPVHTEVFGALTTSKKPFAAVMDMNRADVKLAQVRGSMPAGWAQKNLTKAQITLFDNYPDAMRAIAQGRADAIVDVVDFLGEHMNKHKNVEWQVVDKAIDTWYCGIGVKKGNASLQQWLNVALYTLHRADFVDQTWEKWFGIGQVHSVQPQPYF